MLNVSNIVNVRYIFHQVEQPIHTDQCMSHEKFGGTYQACLFVQLIPNIRRHVVKTGDFSVAVIASQICT